MQLNCIEISKLLALVYEKCIEQCPNKQTSLYVYTYIYIYSLVSVRGEYMIQTTEGCTLRMPHPLAAFWRKKTKQISRLSKNDILTASEKNRVFMGSK